MFSLATSLGQVELAANAEQSMPFTLPNGATTVTVKNTGGGTAINIIVVYELSF